MKYAETPMSVVSNDKYTYQVYLITGKSATKPKVHYSFEYKFGLWVIISLQKDYHSLLLQNRIIIKILPHLSLCMSSVNLESLCSVLSCHQYPQVGVNLQIISVNNLFHS